MILMIFPHIIIKGTICVCFFASEMLAKLILVFRRMILCVSAGGLMESPGGVEAGGGQKVRWRTSQSSLSSSQSKTTARRLHQSSLAQHSRKNISKYFRKKYTNKGKGNYQNKFRCIK